MNWRAGEPIEPKRPLTAATLNSGLDSSSRGYVTHVDRSSVSFYMDRKGGWMEAQCPLDVFALNFVHRAGGINSGYIKDKPFPKVFPKDFFAR